MNGDQGSFECLVTRLVVFPVISEGMGRFIHYSSDTHAAFGLRYRERPSRGAPVYLRCASGYRVGMPDY